MAQQPQDDNALMMREMAEGARLMDEGRYADADRRFRFVLDNSRVLPAEICYYFGINSFFMNKYKQSINWLNKYIELKGTSGQYFDSSIEYLQLAEERYRSDNSTPNKMTIEEVKSDTTSKDGTGGRAFALVECAGKKIVCPVCNGRGVIIKASVFGDKTYKTCPYGDEYGYLTCEEYNLLLQGKLEGREE